MTGGPGPKGGSGSGSRSGGPAGGRPKPTTAEREDAALELARVRDRIDELDTRIVDLLNERATLGRQAGRAKLLAGRRAIHDPEREREVLLRVAMRNQGPISQADLLSIYRRVVAATRTLESKDRG
ncbi:MAG: chorismate mutase, partial [Candidatus Limnocylindrales bacterium]